MEDEQRKRRKIVLDDEEEDEEHLLAEEMRLRNNDDGSDIGSNPDDLLTEEEDGGEEEGEDLMENWKDDYAAAPELDYYDPAVLADEDDEELHESYEKRVRDRMAAEEELDALDARRRAREFESDYNLERVNRFEQLELNEYDEDMEEELQDEGADRPLNLEKFDCPLREWIAEERTRREIQRRFRKFLLTYYDGIEQVADWMRRNEHIDPKPPLPAGLIARPPVYPYKIRAMCAANASSLMMSYAHIAKVQSLLAIWLTDVPRDMLQLFDEVLQSVVLKDFPHYSKISNELHVRITDLPISDRLRDLRQADLNNLVRVTGVVTRRSGVFPQMLSVVYDCSVCAAAAGPFKLTGQELRPDSCAQCGGRGTLKVNSQRTIYGNYQKVTLQETPGTVPPGRIPRYKDVILLGDLVDAARPGDEVDVTGIFTHAPLHPAALSRRSNGCPVFSTIIDANCVMKRHGTEGASSLPGGQLQWAEEDKRNIQRLSRDPRILERILRSIAPSIYGHRHVKLAIALALFGGCAKNGGSGGSDAGHHRVGGQQMSSGALGVSGTSGRGIGNHRVRGDINVLLLGDPGTAKSQILKYAEKTAPRAVYTTGKGASAVGLTAGVHRDPMTKEWTLEGGALVLADKGVCLIDEFDKMNEQDRTSIHEAMEQQTISVSKAGIVTSLQARCSVIAAANPIGGRYDAAYAFSENVELTDPILSRFDILCVLQDIVDPVADEKLAVFVANSHVRSHPDYNPNDPENGMDVVGEEKSGSAAAANSDPFDMNEGSVIGGAGGGGDDYLESIPQDLLRKYIAYARSEVRPILHEVDSEKIALLYSDLRAQSEQTGGIPIAVRHIESIVRMSEASARMHLREHVRSDDVDLAIKVALESFLQAQKISVRKALHKSFRKYVTFGEDLNLLLMHQLQGLLLDVEKYKLLTKDHSVTTEVFVSAFESRAKELKIFDLRPFYQSALFRSHGLQLDGDHGVIRKIYAK